MSVQSTVHIVKAFISNNALPASELASLITAVHDRFAELQNGQSEEPELAQSAPPVPAVPIRKSVTPDAIICLEDGRSFKTLKRHIQTKYGLTPDAYRRRWGLPINYPMVAENYAKHRSQLAKNIGLGRKPRS